MSAKRYSRRSRGAPLRRRSRLFSRYATAMFDSLKVQEIFPTPLWLADLDPAKAARLNRDLTAKIRALTEPRLPLGVGGSWQTDPNLQDEESFAGFQEMVRQVVKGALDFLEIDYDAFEVTGCWANINPQGGRNSGHTHPNNYLSGVYYVAVPEGAGSIEFLDPRVQAAVHMPPVKALNKFNGNTITLPVKPGRLVLFPAWLSHSVPANPTKEERVSISFNIMFSNFAETMGRTLWKKGSTPLRQG